MKKTLSVILALAMVLALIPAAVLAAESSFPDTAGEYGEDSIDRWAAENVLRGFDDGAFHPNQALRRSEAMVIFERLLVLEDEADITDIEDLGNNSGWYSAAMAKTRYAGIFDGVAPHYMAPEEGMTREMLIATLARALGVKEAETLTVEKLADYDAYVATNPWGLGLVNAMLNLGVIKGKGYGDGTSQLDAAVLSTRQEFAVMLDRIIGEYITTNGLHDISGKGDLFTLVVAKDVQLTGAYNGYPIVLYGKDGKVSMTGVTGTATVNVMVSGVTVTGAAVGTVFVTGPKATGLTVNGVRVSENTTYVVPTPGTSGGGTTETSHTVTYHSNYPTGTEDPDPITQPTESSKTDPKAFTVYTLEQSGFTVPDHYAFAGWADAQGDTYEAGTKRSISADLDLYAQWIDTDHTVTYHSNYPTGAEVTKTQDTEPSKTDPKVFTVYTFEQSGFTAPDHYAFAGWADAQGNTYEAGTEYSISADLDLYAQWIDTNDYIGMAVNAAMEKFNSSFKSLENVEHDSFYSIKLNPLGYNSKVEGTGETMTRQQHVNASAGVTTDLANEIVVYACVTAINILGGDSIRDAVPQDVLDLINEVIDAIEASDLGNIFQKGDDLAAMKSRIFNAVRATGGTLFNTSFKNAPGGGYSVSKITVTVGGTSAYLNVSASGISVEGSRNAAVKNMALAIAKDLYGSLQDVTEFKSEVQLTSKLNIEFERADGVDGEHDYPVKYPTTIALDLDSDGVAEVKFDATKGENGQGAVVVKVNGGTIADTYEAEIANVIDELLESDSVQEQIQSAVNSVGEGEGVLSKIEDAFGAFGVANGKEKVEEALTKWIEKNKELLIKGGTQTYDNTDIEGIVTELAEAAAKNINEKLDEKAKDGGLMEKIVNEIIRGTAEPTGDNSLGDLLENNSELLGGTTIDLDTINALKEAGLDTYVYAVICDAMRVAIGKPEEAVFTAQYTDQMKAAVEENVSEQIVKTLDDNKDFKDVLDVLSKLGTLDTAKNITLSELEALVDNKLVKNMLDDMSVSEKLPTLKNNLDRLPANASITVEETNGKTHTVTTTELKGLKKGLGQGIKDLVTNDNDYLKAGDFDVEGSGLKVTVQYNSRTFSFWLWIDFDGVPAAE